MITDEQTNIHLLLKNLSTQIKGELYFDLSHRLIYATDASSYKEVPLGVVLPKNKDDLHIIIKFAAQNNIPIIPRTAGTSLAGQVVGKGLIVDVSKYLNKIIAFNEDEKWVKVEPGVVLDELNIITSKKGLFFGPETSTSNRCMIGGMVGNNSCGAHSLIYGSTRDHVLEINAILSDGSEVVFKEISNEDFENKCSKNDIEGKIYNEIKSILENENNKSEILNNYPKPSIKRRNTGYALDLLLNSMPFGGSESFNLCKLLSGSEGTLVFFTEIKLNLVPLPPKESILVCVHTKTLNESFSGNLIALKHKPYSVELMDNTILELTKDNIEQRKNRFFVKDNPAAILIVEFSGETKNEIYNSANNMEKDMRSNNIGYHFPIIEGSDMKKVWNLRKAGLGILSNMVGDAKPVPVIEDTAVCPEDLPAYMHDFNLMLEKYNLSCVYYAHIATGELHLRPILNLKNANDVALFHTVALDTAKLVKKYKGSLSGEHGDGRLRGEFIPLMYGEHCYNLIKRVKNVFDPHNIFNPNKIVDTPKMNTFLRYSLNQTPKNINTVFNFDKEGGILRAVEKCNGSGDCRKSEIIGGTMCPSYMASKNENQTTRARANLLREIITNSDKTNPFNHKELFDIMDLCLSCKACKSECPSSVDIAKLKAEFLFQYYKNNSVPLRSKIIANINYINKIGILFPTITNLILKNRISSKFIKNIIGFSSNRQIPLLNKKSLKSYISHYNQPPCDKGKVYLFIDEFTNYNECEIGIKTVLLLNKLGYEVKTVNHKISGRTYISKGFIDKAKIIANSNVRIFKDIITKEQPLIGIEPSCLLSFRDEYPDLVDKDLISKSKELAENTLLFEEFFMRETKAGNITSSQFTTESQEIKLHGHCQQKVISTTLPTKEMLSFPNNYNVIEIPSGCCGMAGSFGHEKEHYELSMKIGELVLFPEIRKTNKSVIISAPGTSCRQQIFDGTGIKALHPIEIVFNAIKK